MGKKGTWFSAIKKVFTHNSKEKEKPTDGSNNKSAKEKKKGKGILKRGETKSFIPFFRSEPSSIEKILGEADQLLIRHPKPSEQQEKPPILLGRPTSPRVVSPQTSPQLVLSPKVTSPRVLSPRVHSPRVVSLNVTPPRVVIRRTSSSKAPPHQVTQSWKETSFLQRPTPTLRTHNVSATKIQAAYRGYLARRSFPASRGLVRLQGVMRGQNVKRQTRNAMKQMQLVIKVQTRIHSRRIQMLEKQALQRQASKNDNEAESVTSNWSSNQLCVHNENWDDSILTKEEVEARLEKKEQAVMKRERAMAYAYSHQPGRTNSQSAQSPLNILPNGFPWWWDLLEDQLPASSVSQNQCTAKNSMLTPPRSISEHKLNPGSHSSNNEHRNFIQETATPRSSRSVIPTSAKQFQTTNQTPPSVNSIRYSNPRTIAVYDIPLKDDDSLRSCPAFSVPNYMTSTISANAKVRVNRYPKERLFSGTPGSNSDLTVFISFYSKC